MQRRVGVSHRRCLFSLRHQRAPRDDRIIFLKPDNEIKGPHAPTDGESVADVAAEHGVDRRRQTEDITRREEHLDEFFPVPRVDEPQVDVHRAIERAGVATEETSCHPRVIEHVIENIGALFAAEDGQKHAAAKNRIDEPSSVTGEQPPVAVQLCATIRKIGGYVYFRNALRVRHTFGDDRLLDQRLLKKIFRAHLCGAKSFLVEHNANAGALCRERDDPEPPIDSADEQREGGVDSIRPPDAVVMREERQFLEMIVVFFDAELVADNRMAAAGIDEVARANNLRRSVFPDCKIDMLLCESHAGDSCLFAHFRTAFGSVIEQQLIEIGASDLIRVIGLRVVGILEIKFGSCFGAGAEHFAAKFLHKAAALDFLVQIEPGEGFHAEGQERFADVKTREFFALENDDAATGAGKQRASDAAGRSAADDSHVVDVDLVHPAKDYQISRFGKGGSRSPSAMFHLGERPRKNKRRFEEKPIRQRPKMKLIDRFISRELLVNVLFAIAVLSLVLVVGNIFRKLLPLLVNHDVPVEYLIAFIAYVLPFSLIFTIPWGLLTAILLVFGRLSADNELIALRSNGVSIGRICVPLAFVALICTAICLWLNVEAAPAAQEKLRSTIFDLATRNPMALFGSDQVIDQFPGRKIYVGKKEGNELENIIVFEMDNNALPVKVTYARTGLLEADLENKRILMHLYDARYQQRNDQDPLDLRKIRDGIRMSEGTLPISLEELYERSEEHTPEL